MLVAAWVLPDHPVARLLPLAVGGVGMLASILGMQGVRLPRTNVIAGLALGMKSVALPVLAVAMGVVIAYGLAGLYGLAMATTSMLALTPLVVTIDAFGPVTDNDGGIAEMAGIPAEAREVTGRFDAAGNTTKAVTKAFAIGSAGLAALVLFAAYEVELRRRGFSLEFTAAQVFGGMLIGGIITGLLLALSMCTGGAARDNAKKYI